MANDLTRPQSPVTTVLSTPKKVLSPLDIAELNTQHKAVLAAATSDNTRRSYQSAIRHFLGWGGKLPSDENEVAHYLLAHAETLNPRTLALRLTALSQWHLHQGFIDIARTPTIRKTMAGIRRLNGRPANKAKALSLEDVQTLVQTINKESSPRALRDNALLQLGFFGGFRRSELVGLSIEHLSWEQEGLLITLTRSKTDQLAQGITKAIPWGNDALCPCYALKAWLNTTTITTGPIFRRIDRWGSIGESSLSPVSVNHILSYWAKQANLPYAYDLSSHSLRRGMATSAYRAGANFLDIKKQGGWRHDGTVQGYIEEASRFEENAISVLLGNKK
jgi:integrase